MSVISIRPSQESLRNLGNARMPDRMPHFVPPRANAGADRSIVPNAVGNLAQAIQQGGGQVLRAALQYSLESKERDDNRKLAAAGADYQKRLQDGFVGAADAENGQRVQEGVLKGGKPLMMRTGDDLEDEGLKATESDLKQLFSASFDEVCGTYGITGDLKERFRLHVAPVDLSWSGRMAGHVATERKKNEITEADRKVEADEQTWANDMFDAGTTKMLIDDYDHKLAVRGVTQKARAVDVRKYAQGLAAGIVRSAFRDLGSEQAYDENIRLLKENPDELWNDNAELGERLGQNALPQKTVDLLIDEAKIKKEQFVREQTRQMDAEVDDLISRAGEAEAKAQMGQGDERGKELGQMDEQIEALRKKGENLEKGSKVRLAAFQAAARLDRSADAIAERQMIDECLADVTASRKRGEDAKPTLRQYPAESRKARLRDKVQKEIDRETAKQTEEARAANKEGLSRSLNLLNAMKLDGSISQEEMSEMQARIWAKYKTCLVAGSLPDGFGSTFLSSIKTVLTDQEANAMRKFYKAFGYAPDLKSDGEVGVTERNAAKRNYTDYHAPLERDGQRVETRKTRVTASQLLEYGDALLKTLRTKGPDIDREGVVEQEISRLKTNWIEGDFSKNIEATLEAVQRSTIVFRGRMNGASGGGTAQRAQDTEGKGRRDDDDSATK
jgi:hypothetical protein